MSVRLVRVAPCGCVVVIAAADISTPLTAAAMLGGNVGEWQKMPLDGAVELFARPCPEAEVTP